MLFFAAVVAYYALAVPHHLYFKEQLILFTGWWDEGGWFALKPALLTLAAGDFLTQFFLLTAGGPLLLTALLAAGWRGMTLALRRMGVRQHAALWALLPTGAEALLSVQTEYPVAMPLATALAAWAFVATTALRRPTLRLWGQGALLPLLYALIGAPTLLFAAAAALAAWQQRRRIPALLLLAAALSVPVLTAPYYGLPVGEALTWPVVHGYDLRMPGLFVASTVALLLGVGLAPRIRRARWVALLLTVALIPAALWVRDGRTEYALAMSNNAYFGRWAEVTRLAPRNERWKTVLGAYYANLAEAREGRLAERLLERYQAGIYGLYIDQQRAPYPQRMAAADAYLAAGDLAQAQHAALVGMTFSPRQRSSRMVRRLAEIALLNDDTAAARHYLNLLERTALHRRWARSMRSATEPAGQTDQTGPALPARLARLRTLRPERDALVPINRPDLSLRSVLDASPLENRTAADYLLCFDLLGKDLEAFRDDYDRFYQPRYPGTPPRLYREALAISLGAQQADEATALRYGLDAQTLHECAEYLRLYAAHRGDGHALVGRFAKSYWFYYHYARVRS